MVHKTPRPTLGLQQQRSRGTRYNVRPTCYNCGSTTRLITLCPHAVKNKYTEAPGIKGNESMESNCVSNIVVTRKSSQNNYNKDCESRDDICGELDKIIPTVHGISSDNVTGQVQLGPIVIALMEV